MDKEQKKQFVQDVKIYFNNNLSQCMQLLEYAEYLIQKDKKVYRKMTRVREKYRQPKKKGWKVEM